MTDYKSMFEQAVRTLAAIDEALGIGDDGCGDPDQTLTAIEELKATAQTPFDTCPTCEALARTVMMDQTGGDGFNPNKGKLLHLAVWLDAMGYSEQANDLRGAIGA